MSIMNWFSRKILSNFNLEFTKVSKILIISCKNVKGFPKKKKRIEKRIARFICRLLVIGTMANSKKLIQTE